MTLHKRLRERDVELTEQLERWGKPQLDFWRRVAGNGMWLFVLVGTFLLWQNGLHILHIVLPPMLAYPLALALQNIIRRERPREESKTNYKLWYRTFACPSAHAFVSAAWALVLASGQTGSVILDFGLYVILGITTLLIGLSRLIVGVHYFFDVMLGFFLGALFGLAYILTFSL